MMIYGYLRVSTDKQDYNAQRQGVDAFAASKGWHIGEYIVDDGVSGKVDPVKRRLGRLLKKVRQDDIIIASELSRMGRDLFMVMEILHQCMAKGCVVYTVKDAYVLGDNLTSKVLAFAFGLAAEIERQLICQRSKEGVQLSKSLGVLLGAPPRKSGSHVKEPELSYIISLYQANTPIKQIAKRTNHSDQAIYHALSLAGVLPLPEWVARRLDTHKAAPVDDATADKIKRGIMTGDTLPVINERLKMDYEELYEIVRTNRELHFLYRERGHVKARRKIKQTQQ